jgi:trehalose/maltose hydrolase-like predicted phosphorylase
MKQHSFFILLIGIYWLIQPISGAGQTNDTWKVVASGHEIDPANYFGITSANGVIGLVSAPQPMQTASTVLNGVYDNYGRGRVENILSSFTFTNLWMDVDGERITAQNIQDFSQEMSFRNAAFTNRFIKEEKVEVTTQLMALRHLPYSALMTVEITALVDVEIKASTYIQAPDILRDVRQFYSVIDRPHVSIPLLTSVADSPSGAHKVAASNTFLFEEKHGKEPHLVHEDWDYNRHWLSFTKTIKKGETYRFSLIGSVSSSQYSPDPHNEAERLTIYAALEGVERLLARHNAAWAQIWESDIIIEGDNKAQQEVRSMLYHLYAFTRAGTDYSLSPMGLSGLGYNGHVFWDTEIWMYPPILMLQPDMAHSILEYRFNRMQAARENAFSHGYKGVMFPWESAATGQEVTPVWALTGPFQHHITADIGWSYWKYYQLTKDKSWLQTKGYPMLKEVADFWVSRVEWENGVAHIKNVIGANEYAENIDNNAFTNGMARLALRYANDAASELGMEANPEWDRVAQAIPILQFEDGITRENATYQKGELIKQADVNLLAFPMNIITGRDQIQKDLKYYETVMDPKGPAMGFSVLAAIKARLGDPNTAYEALTAAYRPNFVPPFDVIAETAGGNNPYFATGAGGVLQAILGGFAGLEITDEGITRHKAQLPDAWKKLVIKGVGPDRETITIDNP